jgi:3-hydroxyisobutyrate dehydrogenase-like beta-hydroxyacid dehydrogenase
MTKLTKNEMESINIEKINEAVSFLEQKGINEPLVGVVLGTGLHQIIELLENPS